MLYLWFTWDHIALRCSTGTVHRSRQLRREILQARLPPLPVALLSSVPLSTICSLLDRSAPRGSNIERHPGHPPRTRSRRAQPRRRWCGRKWWAQRRRTIDSFVDHNARCYSDSSGHRDRPRRKVDHLTRPRQLRSVVCSWERPFSSRWSEDRNAPRRQ